jgi:hypothetical protein
MDTLEQMDLVDNGRSSRSKAIHFNASIHYIHSAALLMLQFPKIWVRQLIAQLPNVNDLDVPD